MTGGERIERIRMNRAELRVYELEAKLAEAESSNDELRQEAERLRSDAAYGRTAMDSYAVVQRERDHLDAELEKELARNDHFIAQRNRAEARWVRAEARIAHLEGALRRIFNMPTGSFDEPYREVARAALTASPTMTEGGE